MYRVKWIIPATGKGGHGEWFEDRQFIEDAVKIANEKWKKEIIHSVEKKL